MSDLLFSLTWGELDLTEYPYSVEFGSDFGAPTSTAQALASLLRDGEIEVNPRMSNRTITFNVLVEGADMVELAEAEAALVQQSLIPMTTLTIDPGDGYGVAGVYETFAGSVNLNRDDILEMANLRRYQVTMNALPWVRSVKAVTSPALTAPAGASTTTIISDGSTATGWSRSGVDWTLTGEYGTQYVGAGSSSVIDRQAGALVHVGSNAVGSLRYLVVDYIYYATASGAGVAVTSDPIRADINSRGLRTPVALTQSPFAGSFPGYPHLRAWFVIDDDIATLSSAAFELVLSSRADSSKQFGIDNLAITNAPPMVGTRRQQLRTIAVPGSVRTQSRLKISSPTAGLGDVIAYTWKDDGSGYAPPLRPYMDVATSSAITADSSLTSGFYQSIDGTAFVAYVPIHRVPRGLTYIYARLRRTTPGTQTFRCDVSTSRGGVNLVTQSFDPVVTFGSDWQIVPVARLTARSLAVKDTSDATIRVGLIGGNLQLDDAWLFNADPERGVGGALSVVSCGTSKVLSLETPTVDDWQPRVFVGSDPADESTWVHALTDAMQVGYTIHEAAPSSLSLFTVSTGAVDSQADQEVYPRWHTFPAA